MSTKKLIKDLMDKLNTTVDPIECDDLEDQILRLVEQDEMIDSMTKIDLVPPIDLDLTNELNPDPDIDSDLEPREKIRLEREAQRKAKEENYRSLSKLESKDEELLRTEMLNQALASNDEYAFRKHRKVTGPKNKNKNKQHIR
jgi:hypothetical protein